MSKAERLRQVNELFHLQKVSTLDQLVEKTACHERTIQRYLKQLNSITSFTHSGRYITLEGIPHFDDNGIWFYRKIGFTKYQNSLELIVQLINSSKNGMTREEIEKITKIKIYQQIQVLLKREQLHRVKLGNTYIYIPEEAAKSKKERFKIIGSHQIEEFTDKEVTINDLVAVLKVVLQEGKIEIKSLKQWVKEYALTVPLGKLEYLIRMYKLDEKKMP